MSFAATAAPLVTPKGFLNFNVPSKITKELAVTRAGNGSRKVRISSNWLPLMGFESGDRHTVESIDDFGGLRLVHSDSAAGTQKVYSRSYRNRRNNPIESLIEIGSQSVLNASIPSYTERVHITLSSGEVLIRPLPNHTFSIRKALRDTCGQLQAMVAMTSGIDAHCMAECGFGIDSILEYRPPESRDKKDLSETGALNVLANVAPRILINEDISRVDWCMVKELMASGPQLACLHISLQCDEFSNVKAKSLKDRAVADLSTSRDLVYDALRMIETVRPATVMLEQVGGFGTSAEGQLMVIKLRRWGYHVTDAITAAPDFNGRTGRSRYYLIASIFPGFELPVSGRVRTESIWSGVQPYLDDCRDISHTKSLADGLATGRARILSRDSMVSPTLLKSQNRQAKDSVYIRHDDGRYLMPSEPLMRYLQGFPDSVNLDSVAAELASEIIGQSIDYPMHHELVKSLHDHIAHNVGRHTLINISNNRFV